MYMHQHWRSIGAVTTLKTQIVYSPFRTVFVWDESSFGAANGQYAGLKIHRKYIFTVHLKVKLLEIRHQWGTIVKTKLF